MPIIIFCPGCNTRLTLGDDRAGETIECPRCDAAITIPAMMPPPPPPSPVPPPLPPTPPIVHTWPAEPAEADAEEEEPRAPRSRRRRDDEDDGDEDDKPWARGSRRRRDDDDDGDEDEPPRRSRRRRGGSRKPGKVGAIGGMLIGGGAWALLANFFSIVIFPLWCLWPGLYFAIVFGILAIVRGAGLLGNGWRRTNPHTLLVLQILQLVNLDVINVVLGIIGLVFNNDREVSDEYRW